MKGIRALKRTDKRERIFLSAVGGYSKKASISEAGKEPAARIPSYWHPHLRFLSSITVRNTWLFFKPSGLRYFGRAAQTKTCGQLVIDKGTKTIHWGKDSLFKWCWKH